MRTLKKSECAILPLVLKAKWYGLILHGDKHEEYRDYKEYWIKRICKFRNDAKTENFFRPNPLIKVVAFSRGYTKADLFFIIDGIETRLKNYVAGSQHPEWGEPNEIHFAIKLGKRVQLED